MIHFQVNKTDIKQVKWVEETTPQFDDLKTNQVLFAIDGFSFTANNITYAHLGEDFKYWYFFSPEGEWGSIPCWGFAEVIASKSDNVKVGDRYYGFWPMSSHLIVNVDNATEYSFYDNSSHRISLPPIYNQYQKSKAKNSLEPFQMLFRPLFTTSFLLADYIAENKLFDAKQVVLTSASSKTALGLAYCLSAYKKAHNADFSIVGLTSFGNVYFVHETGYFDEIFDYDNINTIHHKKSVVVDMAGNKSTLLAIDKNLNEDLLKVLTVGKSHWNSENNNERLNVNPELFFAPAHAQKKVKDWGIEQFNQSLKETMKAFYQSTEKWLKYANVDSKASFELIYKHCLNGGFNPESGYIINIKNFEV